CQRYNSIPYTF
nr:immunoglobulin light chain junction region [Macaca mulatta]